MTPDELIEKVKAARADWDEAVAAVDASRFEEPGVAGEWSLKDVIAHVAWFEREMIAVIEARALVGSDLWMLPPRERNDAIWKANRDRPLADVREEAARVWEELLEKLATLTAEEMTDPARFPGMPPDWVPEEIFAQNTYEHYEAHAKTVRERLM
jgi:uncharacterized damage-inducible protein DinB